MALHRSGRIAYQRIASPDALSTLLESFNGLTNNPASLYLSSTSTPQDLIIYVAPTRVVNAVSLQYLAEAVSQGERYASALKSSLETGVATKVFFDARGTAKILFESCGIRLSNPLTYERSRIHEVQVMEVATRPSDSNRGWLKGFDRCIARDSDLDITKLMSKSSRERKEFDERILHLPVLWKKYHDALLAKHSMFGGGGFWVARIREATNKRLAVSCGEMHLGSDVPSAWSGFDRESLEEATEAWNEDVEMDAYHGGEWSRGAEYWAKFDVL